MFLVYLGESGDTGTSIDDANQPHHVHVGLLVHETQSISVNGEFSALFRRHFGMPPGEPGAPPEIRAGDLFQGRGFFRTWPPAKRAELIQDCLNILIRRETPLIAAYLNKRDFAAARAGENGSNMGWQSPSEPTLSRFLLALNMFVDELNMSKMDSQQLMESAWPIADYALVVAGQSQSVKPTFMSEFLKSPDGMDSTAVLDNIFLLCRPGTLSGNPTGQHVRLFRPPLATGFNPSPSILRRPPRRQGGPSHLPRNDLTSVT